MLSAFFGGLDHLLGLKLVANQILVSFVESSAAPSEDRH
jgi:hypothetical protein